jgi:CPA2 family monovalent cation:H+ antiporter-2
LARVGDPSRRATWRNGRVEFEEAVDWPDGTELTISPTPSRVPPPVDSHVIIAGFGLVGRCVADLLDSVRVGYTVIEQNLATVETQQALGRAIVGGNVADSEVLLSAGLHEADVLALTIPDEDAVLEATSLARRLHPEVYIIARTTHSSKGMRASQLGADDVIKAELAVAMQFYDLLRQRLSQPTAEQP